MDTEPGGAGMKPDEPRLYIAEGVECEIEDETEDTGSGLRSIRLKVLVRQFTDGTVQVLAQEDRHRSRWGLEVVAEEEFSDGQRIATGTDEHRTKVAEVKTQLLDETPDPVGSYQAHLALFGRCVPCAQGRHGRLNEDGTCACCRWDPEKAPKWSAAGQGEENKVK